MRKGNSLIVLRLARRGHYHKLRPRCLQTGANSTIRCNALPENFDVELSVRSRLAPRDFFCKE